MDKPFKTYDEQIVQLNNKGLIIDDEDFARLRLKEVGYYHLITGYKDLFKNKSAKKYKRGVKFEDIYSLYDLDRSLQGLFFEYLQIIERTFGSHISYYFCERYGNNQNEYLDVDNYNNTSKNTNGIEHLVGMLHKLSNKPNDYNYIMYYQKHYRNVPLWVLINAITFGSKSKMYELLESTIQSRISLEYEGLTEKTIGQTMKFITKFRNVCAHGSRLYNHRTNEDMPNTVIHKKLEIAKKGSQYIYGKKDLFGVVIACRYLLSKNDFENFKKELDRIILRFISKNDFLDEKEILLQMGFPSNWKRISIFRNY